MSITERYQKIRKEIPDYVTIVLASKTRNKEEIKEVLDAGAINIGENYVQEAIRIYQDLGEKAKRVEWHMIGKLQKNKVNKAIKLFNVIQTIDSLKLAEAIDKRAKNMGKIISVYIEINTGKESQKSGVMPEKAEELIKQIAKFENIKIKGLMTMGPRFGNVEDSRPYFRETKKIFDKIKKFNLPNVEMKVLSMGMSNSYKVAIEEGSNMIRLGTLIFGERKKT
jgi:pyridoxal phosphate enzyme (YggS family)